MFVDELTKFQLCLIDLYRQSSDNMVQLLKIVQVVQPLYDNPLLILIFHEQENRLAIH